MSNHTIIIAEAGVNHNGDLDMAIRLVEIAAEAGADYVKFQTFTASTLVTEYASKAEYQASNTMNGDSQLAMLKTLELDETDHQALIAHCQRCGIGFLSTGFDIQAVDLLVKLGVNLIKVPSGEITNLPYLRHIGSLGLPVILSTGMADMKEIQQALQALENAGTDRENITVLHCTTAYPTPLAEVNLRAMQSIAENCDVKIGYSDHTAGIEVALAAVSLGARVLEKHFTLDKNLPGPDHQASLDPSELFAMVRGIRSIEAALGDGNKSPTPSEIKNISAARKSIVASKQITKGEVFSVDNISTKRPGIGLSPMLWDQVVGKVAKRNFIRDEMIEL